MFSSFFFFALSKKKPQWNFNDSLLPLSELRCCCVPSSALFASPNRFALCSEHFLIKNEAITQEPCLIRDARKKNAKWNLHKLDKRPRNWREIKAQCMEVADLFSLSKRIFGGIVIRFVLFCLSQIIWIELQGFLSWGQWFLVNKK